MYRKLIVILGSILLSHAAMSQREIVSLNGIWEIEESFGAGKVPSRFSHKAQVPGLVNTATPGFEGVDKFYSREYCANPNVRPRLGKLDFNTDTLKIGYSLQKRNYFWYRKTFKGKSGYEAVILKINKAQFGTMVWINGKKVGEYNGCFTAQYYNITAQLKENSTNELIIRIGAHPAVLPASVPAGNDYEKRHWTPGIYDDISLIFTRYPYLETVQVAPDIHKREITVQSRVVLRPGTKTVKLTGNITEWKSGKAVSLLTRQFNAGKDGSELFSFSIPIEDPQLWSPENPFLYNLNLSTGSDNVNVRFGMREFRFDTPTRRAYLNDKLIFLRGSNIMLHRFFDDSLCFNHPWDEQWLSKLLIDLPARYNWNSFRFGIGPVPERWFDIADEAGLLIQNEYFIWSYRPYWDRELLKSQLTDWMRDCWNHPSVAWWDINNETVDTVLPGLIPELRTLDLSNRDWDNGYNLPGADNDPLEDHNYLFYTLGPSGGIEILDKFQDAMVKRTFNSPHLSAHACVLNEYGWLWLKRNGQPTLLTKAVYDSISKGYSNEQRQELYAYLIAAETEYFRAYRNYAGVLHFNYLTGDFSGALTGDIFKNPETLEPVKIYDDYFLEVFKPLGVYVHYFPVEVKPGTEATIPVMVVNDEYQSVTGNIRLILADSQNNEIERSEIPFSVGTLSQSSYNLRISFPKTAGYYWLFTYAIKSDGSRTLCRRKIKLA